jgi:hypothetical protein
MLAGGTGQGVLLVFELVEHVVALKVEVVRVLYVDAVCVSFDF